MPTSTNAINNTVGNSNPGGSNLLSVINLDNTSTNSTASCNIFVGGSSAGPTWTQYTAGTTLAWATGLNTGTQNLEIRSNSSNVVSPTTGNSLMLARTTGNITKPRNSAFLANLTTNQSGATGDGTQYFIPFNNIIFDQNNTNFTVSATGSYFTAPVTGIYQFNFYVFTQGLMMAGGLGLTVGLLQTTPSPFSTTQHVLFSGANNRQPYTLYGDSGLWGGTVVVKMQANDFMKAFLTVPGTNKSVIVLGSSFCIPLGQNFCGETYFSGMLIS